MKAKKLLSVFLVVVLLSVVFSHAVFAKSKKSLVALGDSISFGWNLSPTNDRPSDKAFPSLIANSEDDYQLSNLAVGGAKSGDLLTLLKTKSYRDVLTRANVITLEIGSNDFLVGARSIIDKLTTISGYTPTTAEMQVIGEITNQYSVNMAAVISEIRSVTKAPIILYNIYNPFYGIVQADALLTSSNLLIKSYDSDSSIVVADAFSAFNGKQNNLVMLKDVHPNLEGHKVLAQLGLDALDTLETKKEKDKEQNKEKEKEKEKENDKSPKSTAPNVIDVHVFNYAAGDDEVHIIAAAKSKVNIYSAANGGNLLGSADSVGNGGGAFAKVIIAGGFGSLTKIYATVTKSGHAESSRVAQTVPAIPAAPQLGNITVIHTVHEAKIRVANVPGGANVIIYDNAASRTPIGVGANTSATAGLVEVVVANNLPTAYVAIEQNRGESIRTAVPVQQLTLQSIAPLSDIQVASGTALNAAGLPNQIQITLSDNTSMSVPVTWDGGIPAYDGNTVGTYTFAGTPDLSASPNIAATNLKAAVKVVVEFAAGLGTASDPYIVKTPFQLNNVRKYLSAHYKLGSDIDLNVAPYNQGEGWPIIGTNPMFQGSFDGNGYTIRNLFVNRPTKSGGGLFGVVGETGRINNVKLENVSVTAKQSVGGLAGIIYPGSIVTNSAVTGAIYATGTGVNGQTGGLVGLNYMGTIINSQASVTITGDNRIGGLVGSNWGVISHSRVTASTLTGVFNVGGLVGMNYRDNTVTSEVYIENSYADATVIGTRADSLVGGLAGSNAGAIIKNSYAIGSVTGGSRVGGLAGSSSNTAAYQSLIENSYAANTVTGAANGTNIGGLVGENSAPAQVVSSYYDSVTTGKTDTDRGTPKTTAEMQQISTFSGWDFTNIWTIQANQYPHLK